MKFILNSTENEENWKPKYIQNYDKRLDMGKHTFILIITIYLFLTCYLDIAVL